MRSGSQERTRDQVGTFIYLLKLLVKKIGKVICVQYDELHIPADVNFPNHENSKLKATQNPDTGPTDSKNRFFFRISNILRTECLHDSVIQDFTDDQRDVVPDSRRGVWLFLRLVGGELLDRLDLQ